jgi:hypothetical protein
MIRAPVCDPAARILDAKRRSAARARTVRCAPPEPAEGGGLSVTSKLNEVIGIRDIAGVPRRIDTPGRAA